MTKILSQTLHCSGSSELFFKWVSTFGLPCLSLHCPILERILLSQFSQNPCPALFGISGVRFLSFYHLIFQVMSNHTSLPSARLLLVGLARILPLHPLCFLLVMFHPLIPTPCSLAINSHFSLTYLELSPSSLPDC